MNYDGNCTSRDCLGGTSEISDRWIFVRRSVPSNTAQQHVFDEAMKSASFVTMMFLGTAMSNALSCAVIPFNADTNDTTARPLPYHAALPFDLSQTSGYWAAYFLLMISYFTLSINGSVNCEFLVSMTIKTKCQFQYLQLMLTNIQEEVIQRNTQKEKDKTKNRKAINRTPSALSAHSLTDEDDRVTTGLKENEEQLNKEMGQTLSLLKDFQNVLNITK